MIAEKIYTLLQPKWFKLWRLHAFNLSETVQNKAYVVASNPLGEAEFVDIVTLEAKSEYSLVSTVFNESETIQDFLDSILHQVYKPKDIIICDGGSSDDTVSKIKSWIAKNKPNFLINIIEEKRCSIAKGRNIAAREAKSEILLFADAGTSLDKYWAQNLIKGFVSEVDLVCGWYKPIIESELQKAFAWFVLPKLEVLDPATFLPSARSLAVRKSVYDKTGGFPEHLSFAGEDSLFGLEVKKHCRAVAFVPDAYCYWRLPNNLISMFKTIFRYAKGDGESGKVFWSYYVLLTDKMAALFLHLFFLLFVFFFLAHIKLFFYVSLVLFFTYLNRALMLAASYGAFIKASLSEVLYRCLILKVALPAQLFGFFSGALNRKALNRL